MDDIELDRAGTISGFRYPDWIYFAKADNSVVLARDKIYAIKLTAHNNMFMIMAGWRVALKLTFLKFVRLCCKVASMVMQNIPPRCIYLHALLPPRHKHWAL